MLCAPASPAAAPQLRLAYEAEAPGPGWDLRDEQNRPVRDPEVLRELEAAALEAAYESAFQPDQPTTRDFLALAEGDLGRPELRAGHSLVRDVPDEASGKRWSRAGALESGGEASAFFDPAARRDPARILSPDSIRLHLSSVLLC